MLIHPTRSDQCSSTKSKSPIWISRRGWADHFVGIKNVGVRKILENDSGCLKNVLYKMHTDLKK